MNALTLIGVSLIAGSGWACFAYLLFEQRRQRKRAVQELYDEVRVHDEVTRVGLTPAGR